MNDLKHISLGENKGKYIAMLHHTELFEGMKVTYINKNQKGIIKSIRDTENVFVVYHCVGEWDKYQNYTAALTSIKDLKLGWIEEETCDHEFVYTNAKWQSVNQQRCIFCGKTIE